MRHADAELRHLHLRDVPLPEAVETEGGEHVVAVHHDVHERIDHCTKVSRQIGAALDVEDIIPVAYILEVSSPGIDRVLFTPEQYSNYVGEDVKVRTRSPIEGRRNFKGVIEAVGDADVSVKVDNETFVIPFNVVDRARLVLA